MHKFVPWSGGQGTLMKGLNPDHLTTELSCSQPLHILSSEQILESICSCSHFTDEATEAQRGQAACLLSLCCSLPATEFSFLCKHQSPQCHEARGPSWPHRCPSVASLWGLELGGVRLPVSAQTPPSQLLLPPNMCFFDKMEHKEPASWRGWLCGHRGGWPIINTPTSCVRSCSKLLTSGVITLERGMPSAHLPYHRIWDSQEQSR